MVKCNNFFLLHLKLMEIKCQKLNYNLIVMGEKIQSKSPEATAAYFTLKLSTLAIYKEATLLH
jgi:hypothetical protein